MRHGSSNRRPRNRSNQGGNNRRGNNKNQVFDSNGPDVRIRGTAFQVSEKYLALAKDCQASGDYVLAQSYLQHAEHYQRVINEFQEQNGHSDRNKSSDKSDNKETPKEAEVSKRGSAKSDDGDDLSLPSSILGENSKEKSEDMADA